MNARIEAVYPLAPGQGGILFHAIGGGAPGDNVIQVALDLTGSPDDAADAAAWQALAQRHDVLRTAFAWQNQRQPLQVVGRRAVPRIAADDLSGLDPRDQARRMAEWLAADRAEGFDLSRAPLLRVHGFRLAPDRRRLVVTFHHAILDGWSIPVLLRDWVALRGGETLPPALPFRDHVAWALAQDRGAARAFWRDELAGATPPARLPAPAMPPRDRRGDLTLRLDRTEAQALGAALRPAGVTLATAVQGAWALLLARAAGATEAVYGLARAGRPAVLPGAETRAGMFLVMLPMRARPDPGQPLSAWLAALQDRQTAQAPHEHLPLPEVLAAAGHSGASLLNSAVVFQNYPTDPALLGRIPGLSIDGIELVEQTGLGLTLYAVPRDGLQLRLVFDAAATCADAARLALDDLRAILTLMATRPDMAVGAVTVASRAALPSAPAAVPAAVPGTALPALARIWAEVLDIAPPAPGDNFFDLGGHSLLAITLQDRIRRDLGQTVAIADLFRHATLVAQSAHLARLAHGGAALPIVAPDARRAGAGRLRQRRSLTKDRTDA